MKYRHAFHAGNFADVHKHVALLALLRALTRKDKGLLLIDTHAGAGLYEVERTGEAALGIERLNEPPPPGSIELLDYLGVVENTRKGLSQRNAYPGSPLIALQALRAQDRATFVETQPEEHRSLRMALTKGYELNLGTNGIGKARVTAECADGYERLRSWLPPIERRALIVIDPPYEQTSNDFRATDSALCESFRRLANAVVMIWYPIKHERDTQLWLERLAEKLPATPGQETTLLVSEVWLYPRDNRIGLNGSGVVIANPPWQLEERMREWLPELHARLDREGHGGWTVGAPGRMIGSP